MTGGVQRGYAAPPHFHGSAPLPQRLRLTGSLLKLGSSGLADGSSSATSIIDADLSPGKPLHAETWVHLLEERGFRGVARRDGSVTRYVVTGVRER